MIGIITAFLYLIQNAFNVILREQCRLLAEYFFLSIPLSPPVTKFTQMITKTVKCNQGKHQTAQLSA